MVDAAPPSARQQSGLLTMASFRGALYRAMVLISAVLRVLVWPLRRLSLVIFPPKEYDGITQSADQAARAFSNWFRSRYQTNDHTVAVGSRNDDIDDDDDDDDDGDALFSDVGFVKTLVRSQRENTTTLVYLHSPLHPRSDAFCREVLRDARVRAALRRGVACWGGSVHTADGAHAARSLRVDAYPFCALLAGRVGARASPVIDVLWRTTVADGDEPTSTTAGRLAASVAAARRAHAEAAAEAEARRLLREREAELRREQDREYREALEADRRREAERRAKTEAEAAAREEEERRVAEEARAREEALAAAKETAGEEPPPGAPGVTRVRVALPTGARVDRRFRATDKIAVVRAFLTVHMREKGVPIERFELSSAYPRRTWTDHEVTLEEAGLCPQAVLMLQDLDA